MVKVYYDNDIEASLLHQLKVGVVGYGSQGRGKFAKSWTGDPERSFRDLEKMIRKLEGHSIEKVGREVRKLLGLEK